jgi:hypothetical protein
MRFNQFFWITFLPPKNRTRFFLNQTAHNLSQDVVLSRNIFVWISLKQNWPRINNFCELRTYFYRFFSTAPWSHPSLESKNLLAVDREGLSLQYLVFSHLFLSARYRPFQSSWRRGLFPQQFQHSTPTTPLSGWSLIIWAQDWILLILFFMTIYRKIQTNWFSFFPSHVVRKALVHVFAKFYESSQFLDN